MSLTLKVQQLAVGYQEPLFKPVDFEISQGETLFIIGANGKGKSTLGKTLIGLLSPLRGEVHFKNDLKIGYMPQGRLHCEFLPLKVKDFLNLFSQDRSWAQIVLKRLEIQPLLEKSINHLSFGQWQRVNLAQALLAKPQLLLVDEPAQGLDALWQERIYDILSQYTLTFRSFCLCISHDSLAINNNADWIYCLDHSSFTANSHKKSHKDSPAFSLLNHRNHH